MATSHNFVKLFEEYRNGLPDTEINKVRYGQPTKEKHELASVPKDKIRDWFMDNGLTSKLIDEAPANDSETTRKDLDIILGKMKNATGDDLTFARYVDHEENVAQVFIDFLESKGIELGMGDWFSVDSQTESLLFWLKNAINRPRPYQLAYYYELPFYQLIHTDASSAAYPSGHALTAFVMSEHLSLTYPEHRAELIALGKRVAESRELTGIHYPSDTAISQAISDIIFKNKLLTIR
jgi:acid phosphatase (class A)